MPNYTSKTWVHDTTTTVDLREEERMAVGIGAVDLFCGAGGLSLGLQQAGINVHAGIDLDPACRYPFETNLHAEFHELNIRDLDADSLWSMWGDESVRLLAGCAPCQPFSSQRRGASAQAHESWDLLLEFGRLIEATAPDYVTMENVPRLRNERVFIRFLNTLINNGYYVDYDIIKAEGYGLPQRRRRLVLVAALHRPIHIPPPSVRPGEETTVTQALKGLPHLASGETCPSDPLHCARKLSDLNLKRRKVSVPGGTWRTWPDELLAPCHKKASGKSFQSFYGVMAPNEPAPTITTEFYNYGSGRFGHPTQIRAITPREAAVLQGFPRTYQFISPGEPVYFTRVGKMIGNAVPPTLGRLVGATIVNHLQRTDESMEVM